MPRPAWPRALEHLLALVQGLPLRGETFAHRLQLGPVRMHHVPLGVEAGTCDLDVDRLADFDRADLAFAAGRRSVRLARVVNPQRKLADPQPISFDELRTADRFALNGCSPLARQVDDPQPVAEPQQAAMDRRDAVIREAQLAGRGGAHERDRAANCVMRVPAGAANGQDDFGKRSHVAGVAVKRIEVARKGFAAGAQPQCVDQADLVRANANHVFWIEPSAAPPRVAPESSTGAVQVDAIQPAINRLQIRMAALDVGVIEATRASRCPADERKGRFDDLNRRLRLVGRGDRQAKHARQKRAVIAFQSQHVGRSHSATPGLSRPPGGNDAATKFLNKACARGGIRRPASHLGPQSMRRASFPPI